MNVQLLKNIRIRDAGVYGGKAASLGEMISVGIPVPGGFAVSAAASRSGISDDFKKELDKAFDRLGADRVAVRSSALAEDAADASWAGQLESYLNVDRAGLEEAVRKCWRSIDSRRAREYAADKRINESDRMVGVVVQKMLDSEVSGVMFTAHPVLNDKNQLVIESLYGLGEMIVQGLVTPDSYVVDKTGPAVTEFNIAVKEKMMAYKDGATRTLVVPDNLADRASLREEEVLALARLGIKIEKHYGRPQDIEWSKAAGQFYIVQSRPITTL